MFLGSGFSNISCEKVHNMFKHTLGVDIYLVPTHKYHPTNPGTPEANKDVMSTWLKRCSAGKLVARSSPPGKNREKPCYDSSEFPLKLQQNLQDFHRFWVFFPWFSVFLWVWHLLNSFDAYTKTSKKNALVANLVGYSRGGLFVSPKVSSIPKLSRPTSRNLLVNYHHTEVPGRIFVQKSEKLWFWFEAWVGIYSYRNPGWLR